MLGAFKNIFKIQDLKFKIFISYKVAIAKKFEDLEVWIAAKDFCVSIYKITENEYLKIE